MSECGAQNEGRAQKLTGEGRIQPFLTCFAEMEQYFTADGSQISKATSLSRPKDLNGGKAILPSLWNTVSLGRHKLKIRLSIFVNRFDVQKQCSKKNYEFTMERDL